MMIVDLMDRFRALSLYYQEIHWTLKGSFFYQDHLLADRLQEETDARLDMIAERGMGAYDTTVHVQPLTAHLARVNTYLDDYPHNVSSNADYWRAVLRMELEIKDFITKAVPAEKDTGMQNLLQDLADEGNNRIYLLRHRVQAYAGNQLN